MSGSNYGPPRYPPQGYQYQNQQQYQQNQGYSGSEYCSQQFQRPNGPPPEQQWQQQQYQRPSGPPRQQYPPQQQQDWESDSTDFRPSNNFEMQNNSHGMPPTGMQSYGNGQGFQYSNNQGKRKALLIGINYFNTSNQLGGCINDATAMANYLERNRGYKRDDMVILTDDQSNPRSWPTKQNIIQAMQWLVAGARPNDCLFFHYSGHGGVTKDLDGDEDDGYDEVIYPVDFKQAGHIVDDDMHAIMVKPLPPGCRLTALFDSCHSGTALDLPFVYSTKGCIKEPNMYKDAGMGILSAVQSYDKGDLSGAFTSVKGAFNRLTNGDKNVERVRQAKFSPADVISFSGCKDSQTSADSQQGSVKAGAMSYAFLEVMSQNPNQTYYTLLNNVRNVMAGKFGQKPQLSCSHPLDMNLLFIL